MKQDHRPKPTWRIWLIKKLLTDQINKDDIYDNSLDVHLLYIGSPKRWLGVFR